MKKKEVEKKELELLTRMMLARELGPKKKTIRDYKYWIMIAIFVLIFIPGFLYFNNKLPGEAETYVQPQPLVQSQLNPFTQQYNESLGETTEYLFSTDGIMQFSKIIMFSAMGLIFILFVKSFLRNSNCFYTGLNI